MEARDARARWPFVVAALALPLAIGMAFVVFPEATGRMLVVLMAPRYSPTSRGVGPSGAPAYLGKDAQRDKIAVRLEPVAHGFEQPVDIQFFPGDPHRAVIVERQGTARWVGLNNATRGVLFEQQVLTASEQGLLGFAFHPAFTSNRTFFINYVNESEDGDCTFVERWQLDAAPPDEGAMPAAHRVEELLRVPQPYPNHNAGQLAFGPDGYLYVGLGDGGLRDDPHAHGQNLGTLLGSMLRIDVDQRAPGLGYAIPADNPFVSTPGARPELWAYGLRNPWRFSFDPSGRLIVADVGQNAFEEIDLVPPGGNMGWALREGFACFPPERACDGDQGLVPPVVTYGRDEGVSVTGGFVYTGSRIPALRGHYVFGDFVTGRMWAVMLPALPADAPSSAAPPALIALGQWPMLISTFGQDAAGELYVADYAKGAVYRIAPARDGSSADGADAGIGSDDVATPPPTP